ncbi:LANO_0G15742g1_1 [Lachancea nothofagi CBS 11611]|uniref:LANO_0G15742g1_1 n=1 Tax=Lachancea nothofagi CBS 11611 TaxID=1266666 RepID=A0A1G4KKG9_9SACH|nr:LANO_0G15742g1_1 [Lachancea nothofagi CBS 11611]
MHIVVSDFDETITKKDTISALAELPYLYKSFPIPWSHFIDTYLQGFQKFETPARDLPILHAWIKDQNQLITDANFEQMFSSEIAYQKALRPIELNSVNELESKSAFSGITQGQVKEFAQSKTSLLRDDFLAAWKSASELHILSVNWSRDFIEAVLYAAASKWSLMSVVPTIQTTCNNLAAQNGNLTGQFEKSIVTGYDKVEKLETIVKTSESDSTIWYIGDSETDLLSILYPSVNGVLLLDPKESLKKFQKISSLLGLDSTDFKEYLTNPKCDTLKISCKKTGAFYFVKTWKALTKMLR